MSPRAESHGPAVACPRDDGHRPTAPAGDAGASAVEFALLLPIFLMLVFGGIYGGIAIDHKIGITQAAREGARFGSTLPIPPQPGQTEADWLGQVLTATESAAYNDITPGADSSTICVAFVDPTNATNTQFVTMSSSGAPATPASPCLTPSTSLGATQFVQVDIGRDVVFDIGIARWPLRVTSSAVVQYERPGP